MRVLSYCDGMSCGQIALKKLGISVDEYFATEIKPSAIKVTNIGSFNTEIEAFQAYKEAKEANIKEVANKWKDQIDPRVYEALMNYHVEITD